MAGLIRYGVGMVVVGFVLTGVFESINPPSWPESAVILELVGCFIFCAAILAMNEVREKKQQEQREMDKYFAELRSKEQVELEKHRLTLAAQREAAEAKDKHSATI